MLKAVRPLGNGTSGWKRIAIGALEALGATAALLLAAAIFQYGYDLPPPRSDETTANAAATTGGAPSASDAKAPAAGAGAESPSRTPRADDAGPRVAELIPGQEARPSLGWMFAGLILFVAGAVVLVLSRPQIVVKDSKSFRDALAIWNDVILTTQDTPRKLKRFMNRLRWLAMRTRKIEPAPGVWGRARQALDEFLGREVAEDAGCDSRAGAGRFGGAAGHEERDRRIGIDRLARIGNRQKGSDQNGGACRPWKTCRTRFLRSGIRQLAADTGSVPVFRRVIAVGNGELSRRCRIPVGEQWRCLFGVRRDSALPLSRRQRTGARTQSLT
ncbi:MAG: hypothetical protein AABM64_06770 [Pseudomonadota bacterium]